MSWHEVHEGRLSHGRDLDRGVPESHVGVDLSVGIAEVVRVVALVVGHGAIGLRGLLPSVLLMLRVVLRR